MTREKRNSQVSDNDLAEKTRRAKTSTTKSSHHHPEQISHHNLRSQNNKPSIKEGQKQNHYTTMMESVLHLLRAERKERA